MRARWAFTAVGLALTATLFVATVAFANTIHVQNTHDHGHGSLRKALTSADPGDAVKVPAGHYELSSGELSVDAGVRVTGAGARKTILDANRNSRVMGIAGSLGTVKLAKLTVRDGDTDGMEDGAGIQTGPGTTLVLDRVAVLNNHAITTTDISNGGGVDASGPLVIKQSLFAGNHGYNGGAVAGNDTIKAVDSTFFNNFGGNPFKNGDGGVFDDDATLIDSTLVGNQCFNGDGCGGASGGGLTLKGTILAGNTAFEANGMPAGSAGNPGSPDNCTSPATSNGHNLDNHHDCALAGSGDISGKNPHLGSLGNNGGPTDTLAFGKGSPVFNAGSAHCTAHDQRGVKRPQGPRCDIGAFELKR